MFNRVTIITLGVGALVCVCLLGVQRTAIRSLKPQILLAEKPPEQLLSDKALMARESGVQLAAIKSLAGRDPEAAVRHSEGLSDEKKDSVSSEIILELLRSDAARGVAFLQALDASGGWSKTTSRVLKSALEDQECRALTVTALREEGIDQRFVGKRLAKRLILETLKGETVQSGLNILSQIPIAETRNDFVFQTAVDLRETYPDRAMSWIMKGADPEKRAEMISSIMSVWTKHDFNAAGEWLGLQEPSSEKDAAIAAFADRVCSVDPKAALVWAGEIEEPISRESNQRNLFNQWVTKDRKTAEQWLATQDLRIRSLMKVE